ncbi:MAG: penicillin acylase family protein [Bacillota bacterium]
MSRLKKRLLIIFVVLLVIILGGAGFFYFTLRSSMASHTGTIAAGTADEASIQRCERGVAYIKASSPEDLYFAQGYAHAQERLWQMEFNRRVVQGRLSETIGEDLLESDIFLRKIGLQRIAERIVDKTSPEGLAVLQSYARGINAFLKEAKQTSEMLLLGVTPEPWDETDVAGILTLMTYDLGSNFDIEQVRLALKETISPQLYAEIMPPFEEWDTPAIYTGEQSEANVDPQAIFDLLDTADLNGLSAYLPSLGSNSWVISPDLSAGGTAIMANDPHLGISLPSIWFENCLEIEGQMPVYGWSIPGMPLVVIGHNERIAWGMTNIGDTQDLFFENQHPEDPHRFEYEEEWYTAEVIEEEIKVKGQDQPELLEIIITRNGPLISDDPPMSLSWTAYDIEASAVDAVIDLNQARNWNEFRLALFDFTIPMQNFVYADVDGNIGFRTAGLAPIRKQGLGLEPAPGWSADYGWDGYIPTEEMPELYNPPQGYIATANHRVTDDSYPYMIAIDDATPYRMQRIVDQLSAGTPLTLEDIKAMQTDWFNPHAAARLQQWLDLVDGHAAELGDNEQEGLELLKEWAQNPISSSEAAAPAIYANWYLNFMEEVFKEEMDEEMYERFISNAYIACKALDYQLEKGNSAWFNGSLDEILLVSYQETIEELEEKLGSDLSQWQWQDLQSISFDHALGEVDMLKPFFNRGPYPYGGDNETVGRANYSLNDPFNVTLAAGLRFIAVMEPQIEAYGVFAGGQSGHFMSDQYDQYLETWLEGRYYRLNSSSDKLSEQQVSEIIFLP